MINRDTVKISYVCMTNFKRKICSHNFKIPKEEEVIIPNHGCNCTRTIVQYPIGGNCLVDFLVYRAEVKDANLNCNTYTGLNSNTFKKRFYGTGSAS